ncbi:MAG: hypothetical protein ACYC6W_03155 [Nitrosotalea sp.]
MNQARIKTEFGEIVIEFTDESDLNNKIETLNVNKIIQTINEKINTIKMPIQVMEEFKDLYTVDSQGIRLLKYPAEKSDQIRLILFLSGRSLTPAELKYATGIDNPTSLTASKGFQKIGNTVTIDSEVRKLVLEKIIPEVRGKK